ncbi:NAD-P-binding protein [Artomyces pyxidatus]|uniref:NAD-P-binding protein n=1 Tax=Artomyces pyxidatus TaxID=48021 RepID=A0ACB8TEA8_9AGAM|nr:NAD-P-binding protein [Artomyces pyxidatus]
MSGFKNFAIVGAGNFGTFVVDEFLKAKTTGAVDKVVLLTRPDSVRKFAAAGADVIAVDYADRVALAAALTGIDVVVSTLGRVSAIGVGPQAAVAAAAKEAGVGLFVPSEFGGVAEGTGGMAAEKGNFRAYLQAIGLAYVLFYTGVFADYAWSPLTGAYRMVGLGISTGKVSVGGDGNALISFTARADVARFVVCALTKLPVERLENQAIRIEGDRQSFNQIFKAYEQRSGHRLEVAYRTVPELQAALRANPKDMGSQMHLSWASGEAIVGTPDNNLYPDWNPKKVIDVLVP